MKLISNNIKRLSIFIFYDKDGIVDDYVVNLLANLKRSKTDIIIVSNISLNNKEKNKLKKYSSNIFERENKGLDAGAFKYIYDKVDLKIYDEVVVINDTFFGPFVEFNDIFNTMNQRDLDFWGLTANYTSKEGYHCTKDGYFKSHIQTFFIAFRNNVLISDAFNKYWKKYNIAKMNDFFNVVTKHEVVFTNYLESAGFKWDTYVDLSYYKSVNPDLNYNIYAYSSFPLLLKNQLPIIKRKNMIFDKNDSLYLNNGMDASSCLEYLKNNNIYDIDLIFKNIIRIYNYDDIYNCLNLNYINKNVNKKYNKKLIIVSIKDNSKKWIVNNYLSKLKEVDIVEVPKIGEYLIKNKKTLSSKYNYVSLLNIDSHFKKNFVEVDDSNLIRLFENGFKDDQYINGVVEHFNNDKYLGVLTLPISIHNSFFSYFNNGIYNKKFIKSKMLYNIDAIWFKSEILNHLNDKYSKYTNNKIIAIIPEKAHVINCYVGKIYNESYVKNDLIAYEKILNKTATASINMVGQSDEQVSWLRKFARRHISYKIRRKILEIVGKIK